MIAIISDIHGNYPALQAVLNEIDKIGCKKIISLGDVAGYNCMINECIEELKSRNITNLMGNHDNYLISGIKCPRSNSANFCLEYQRKIIKKKNILWLANSLNKLTINKVNMVHGGWKNNIDEYMYDVGGQYFENIQGDIFFSGHTHIQILKHLNSKIYCNPGSVGQPRDGDWRAAFVVYDTATRNITLKRVEYDIKVIEYEMKKAKFEEYYYKNLYYGRKIGETINK